MHQISVDAECTVPLIKGQVSISELCEQSPLQDLLGSLVLDEINNDMV